VGLPRFYLTGGQPFSETEAAFFKDLKRPLPYIFFSVECQENS
jgi:hypothetical protein